MIKVLSLFAVTFLFPFFLCAGTVRLINNSPYELRVVIRGSDGSYLSEMVIRSQKESVWTDTYGQFGMYGGANESVNENYRSKTPYTVLWYCLAGDSYGVCDNVATGAVVMAQGCIGNRMCPPQKQDKVPYSQPEGNYLHPEVKPLQPPPLNQ